MLSLMDQIGIGIIVGAFIYLLTQLNSKKKKEYQIFYDQLVTADEYKVKGQFD